MTIRSNSITDQAGTGAPDFPNGLTTESITISSAKTLFAEKTSSTALSGSTDIVFDSVISDTFSGEYNNSTGVFTASESGLYLFSATARATGTITTSRMALLKNGSEFLRNEENSSSISIASHNITVILSLVNTDTVKFQLQASGGTNIDGTAFKQNWINITKIG